jgi:hypothetical protein
MRERKAFAATFRLCGSLALPKKESLALPKKGSLAHQGPSGNTSAEIDGRESGLYSVTHLWDAEGQGRQS